MKKYFDSVIGATGAPIANAAVTVYILSTSTPAALFSDAAGTVSITNPAYTDATGRFEFYAADGRYSLSINAGGFVIGTVYDILLDDPADASAGVFTNLTVSGTVTGITKAHVGLSGVDNTADAVKPISTPQANALTLKADLAAPTFTGAVGGITKTMVGLPNVDNTSDASKPISTATQSALDSKGVTGFRNKVMNGNFAINQLAVSGTVTLAAGVYGHDMYKAGAGGCTYTFAASGNGMMLTITAGTLMQVIEGAHLEGGSMKLSWFGTATGRVDTGAYGASGVAGTAVAGTNQTIEFGIGTASKVQYELGTMATTFEQRPYGLELALCQRYYLSSQAISYVGGNGTNTLYGAVYFPVQMRVAPTIVRTGDGAVSSSTAGTVFSTITPLYALFYNTGTGAGGTFTASARL